MPKKRILLSCGLAVALLVLLGAAAAGILLARNVPGVARLLHSDPAEPTPPPAQSLGIKLEIPTLTPGANLPPPPTAVPQPSHTPTAATLQVTTAATITPTLVVTVTPTLTPTATPAGPRPWIAFESKRGKQGDYEIMVMGTDGKRLSNLTGSWADDIAPAWSPDGRWLAFVSLRDTLSGKAELEGGNLYILPFDPVTGKTRGQVARLTDYPGAEGWPAWSPDGRRIAFHADIDGGFDIWVINVDGSGLTRLTQDPAEDKFPAWSPDGKRIAFTSTRSGNYDVWVANADGSNPANLTRHAARDRYPIWSPDGKRLTFNTDRDGKQEIYIMNADGSGLKNITKTPKYDEGLADWSPDGRRVVLYSEQKKDKDIYIVDLSTGKWTNLTQNPASDEYCAWWP